MVVGMDGVVLILWWVVVVPCWEVMQVLTLDNTFVWFLISGNVEMRSMYSALKSQGVFYALCFFGCHALTSCQTPTKSLRSNFLKCAPTPICGHEFFVFKSENFPVRAQMFQRSDQHIKMSP